MIIPTISSPRPAICRTTLIALGCAFSLALVLIPVAKAAEAATPQAAATADKAPILPLTAKFKKVKDAEHGPYTLRLKNTSKSEIKVTAQVLLSVAFHATDKARNLPVQAIAAGKSWTVADLAAGDKVILKADGFAPLELTVP